MIPISEGQEKRKRDDRFAEGVCAALAVVACYDYETVWREIVAACGGYDYLYAVSKRGDNLYIDGFTQYKRPASPQEGAQ